MATAGKLLLVVGALSVGMCLGESLFRLRYPPPTFDKKWISRDYALGYAPKGGVRVRATRKRFDRTLYDVVYTVGRDGLRRGSNKGARAGRAVMFFGCSFTFGTGVSDAQAFPALFEAGSRGTYKSFNFAFPGYGPLQMLARLEDPGQLSRILRGRRAAHAVYLAIPTHPARAAGRAWWDARSVGPFQEFARLLGRSVALGWLMERVWLRDNAEDLEAFAGFLKRCRVLLQRRYGSDLLVILWWNDETGADVARRLASDEIPFVPISEILPGVRSDPWRYLIPGDAHPNAKAHGLIADYLIKRFSAP